MIDDLDDINAFVRRIAEPLRAPERADSSFRNRVMSTIHGMTRTQPIADQTRVSPSSGVRMAELRMPAWWKRPYWIRVTPLSALAMAAVIVALAVAVAALQPYALASGRQAPQTAVKVHDTVHDTVHVVRFVFVDSGARSVSLVGEFNNWRKGALVLHAGSQPGVWVADVPLTPGRHEYAFIVRDATGERWVADPAAESRLDDFGTESSVISIGTNAS